MGFCSWHSALLGCRAWMAGVQGWPKEAKLRTEMLGILLVKSGHMFRESEKAREQREREQRGHDEKERGGRGGWDRKRRKMRLPRCLGASQVPVASTLELIRTSCPCSRRSSPPYTESAILFTLV